MGRFMTPDSKGIALRHLINPQKLAAMNNLALLLATSTDPGIRNPKEAVTLAQKAVEVEADNAAFLDTLAQPTLQQGSQTEHRMPNAGH